MDELTEKKKELFDTLIHNCVAGSFSKREILAFYNDYVDLYIKPDLKDLTDEYPELIWKKTLVEENEKKTIRLGMYHPFFNKIYLSKETFDEFYQSGLESYPPTTSKILSYLFLISTIEHEHRHFLQHLYYHYKKDLKNQIKQRQIESALGEKGKIILDSYINGNQIIIDELYYLHFLISTNPEFKNLKENTEENKRILNFYKFAFYVYLEDEIDARRHSADKLNLVLSDIEKIYGKKSKIYKYADNIFSNLILTDINSESQTRLIHEEFLEKKLQISVSDIAKFAADMSFESLKLSNSVEDLLYKEHNKDVFKKVLQDKLKTMERPEIHQAIKLSLLSFMGLGNVWGMKYMLEMARAQGLSDSNMYYSNLKYLMDNGANPPTTTFFFDGEVNNSKPLEIFNTLMKDDKYELARASIYFAKYDEPFILSVLDEIQNKVTKLKQSYLNETLEYEDVTDIQDMVDDISNNYKDSNEHILNILKKIKTDLENIGYLQAFRLRENLPPEEIVKYNYDHFDSESRKQYVLKGDKALARRERKYGKENALFHKAHKEELGE